MKEGRREKIGSWIAGIGFALVLFFGAAIDGPGNDMRVVYTGVAAGITLMALGATVGDMREW